MSTRSFFLSGANGSVYNNKILQHFRFDERIRGDHHIYSRSDVEEIINIQPDGAMAKAYQVKQVRNIIIRYKLGGLEDA